MFIFSVQNGDTCLHISAALDRKPIVKRLLQWAADPSLVNHVKSNEIKLFLNIRTGNKVSFFAAKPDPAAGGDREGPPRGGPPPPPPASHRLREAVRAAKPDAAAPAAAATAAGDAAAPAAAPAAATAVPVQDLPGAAEILRRNIQVNQYIFPLKQLMEFDLNVRHRLEHEGSSVLTQQSPPPRSYLEPIVPKAMSTESLSQASRG